MAKDGTVRDSKNNTAVKFPRNGAFEIMQNNTVLFSKLKTKKWPTTEQVIESIEKEKARIEGNINLLADAKDVLGIQPNHKSRGALKSNGNGESYNGIHNHSPMMEHNRNRKYTVNSSKHFTTSLNMKDKNINRSQAIGI